MKIVVFAGGSGKRFWPLSRNKFPKQFQPIINDKSTIELMVGRIADVYGWGNIFMPTTKILVPLIEKHLPSISKKNIFTEPTRRDLGAAVGYAMIRLRKAGFGDEPVSILWSDNFPANGKAFQDSLKAGEELIKIEPNRIIFLGEKPTFPNDNLGWIELGEKIDEKNGISAYKKENFKYRPSVDQANEWFNSENYVWNTGYFVSTPNFILKQYEKQNSKMYSQLVDIENAIGTDKEEAKINEIYPVIETTHFDNVVLEGLDNKEAIVLKTDFNWTDPGTLYALKQFLQKNEEDTITKGLTYTYNTKDSLVYNLVEGQILTTVGLDGYIVVNTPDAVLVCHKDEIGNIKKMLEEWEGTELERFM
ncbi:mannose-1-phosphate guanylyltransferase [Candidatus Dojkabacteria bacterium]|nr:mannose-1-phosphate guanylyltransferase [Candidatus Dojkabacteria bacterium]